MKRELICLFMAACVMTGVACDQPVLSTESSSDSIVVEEVVVPEGSVLLNIGSESNGKRLRGFGAECDPLFISENVGSTGEENGVAWECKEEDWNVYMASRMEEMNLQRIRVMLCPGYFSPTYENYANKNYTWGSEEMASVYQVLETAQKLDITVNITYWGVDVFKSEWLAKDLSGWMSFPKPEYEDAFCELFTDAIKYLKEDRGYTCIQEITVFNEPNWYGFDNYVRVCRSIHQKFTDAGLRDDIDFNLADSAEGKEWLANCVEALGDIADLMNAHSYFFGYGQTNQEIYDGCKSWVDCMGDSGLDLYFGEFGTNKATTSHTATDNMDPERGLEICRIAANMVNAGIVGASYWVLFSQVYNRNEVGRYMDMGLWGFANEGYDCRPVYYAYSLLTRFAPQGAYIYPIQSGDENIVAFAVRTPGDKWSYFAVNNSDDVKKLAFKNDGALPSGMKRYCYDVASVPTDNQVISEFTQIANKQNYLFDEIGPQSVVVYTQL